MLRELFHIVCFFGLLVLILGYSSSSWAFYSYVTDSFNLDLGGFLGAGGGVAKYPGEGLYKEQSDGSWFGDVRLLAEAGDGENLVANVNVLQNVRSTPTSMFTGSGSIQRDVERSGFFYWQQHDSQNTQAAMVLDAASIKFGNRSNELTVGRQPVSTTVTFYFTPNDFFAPFSPNTFFRVYKPGVDALRYERRLAALSQLSVIGVLGYDSESSHDSGWSNTPDWDRSTVLTRLTHTTGMFEWGLVGGLIRESMVTGLSLQGELFEWLGIRAEGNYANTWADNQDSGLMATASFEHRFASSLTIRLEYMFNGCGADSIAEALVKKEQGVAGQGYLGRHYSALDLSYELSPLVFGEVLYLRNWTDDSYSVSFNAIYSVSDESDLALTAMLPGGSEPDFGEIQSELGALPVQFSLEYRYFF